MFKAHVSIRDVGDYEIWDFRRNCFSPLLMCFVLFFFFFAFFLNSHDSASIMMCRLQNSEHQMKTPLVYVTLFKK